MQPRGHVVVPGVSKALGEDARRALVRGPMKEDGCSLHFRFSQLSFRNFLVSFSTLSALLSVNRTR